MHRMLEQTVLKDNLAKSPQLLSEKPQGRPAQARRARAEVRAPVSHVSILCVTSLCRHAYHEIRIWMLCKA